VNMVREEEGQGEEGRYGKAPHCSAGVVFPRRR
jgi:hypothetical protein